MKFSVLQKNHQHRARYPNQVDPSGMTFLCRTFIEVNVRYHGPAVRLSQSSFVN